MLYTFCLSDIFSFCINAVSFNILHIYTTFDKIQSMIVFFKIFSNLCHMYDSYIYKRFSHHTHDIMFLFLNIYLFYFQHLIIQLIYETVTFVIYNLTKVKYVCSLENTINITSADLSILFTFELSPYMYICHLFHFSTKHFLFLHVFLDFLLSNDTHNESFIYYFLDSVW